MTTQISAAGESSAETGVVCVPAVRVDGSVPVPVPTVEVSVYSKAPLRVSVDATALGLIWAHASDDEQVAILAAMLAGLKEACGAREWLQRDYIAIALAKPENAETREFLRYIAAEG